MFFLKISAHNSYIFYIAKKMPATSNYLADFVYTEQINFYIYNLSIFACSEGVFRPVGSLFCTSEQQKSVYVQTMIITVRWSRLSSKVRAIVPVLQSHFDFACLLWTY